MTPEGSRPSISAALIVRNEEGFLPGCLQSLAGQVDEIVVVDTGSTDGTVEIAHTFGTRLLHFVWQNDFAAARNYGLDAVRTDWVLYIDADERLVLPGGARLTDGLGDPDVVAARPRLFPRAGSGSYREMRIFRSHPRLRFRFPIHETMIPAITELIAEAGGRVLDSPAVINHLGYEGDLSHKHRRNLPLLREAVRQHPDRIYFWCHLAETLEATGDLEGAKAACRDGLAAAQDILSLGANARLSGLLSLTLARLLRDSGEGDPMAEIERGLQAHPDQRALLFLRARVLVDRDEHSAALAILDRLRFEDGPSFSDPEVAYDLRIFGALAHDLAGVSLLRQGRRREAAEAFALAAAAEPTNPAYRAKAIALSVK